MQTTSFQPAQRVECGYSRPTIQLQRQFDSDVAVHSVFRTDVAKPLAEEKELESNVFYYDNTQQSNEYEPILCTPGMCGHPYALLRWVELFSLIAIYCLVGITCVGTNCTIIIHKFGYKAHGQAFVLFADALLAISCVLILTAYAINTHKAQPLFILGFERLYCMGGIFLMIICGIIGTHHALETIDEDINKMGRGKEGIRPQWIAAAVLEFCVAILFATDYFGQTKKGFPFVFNYRSTPNDADGAQLRNHK